MKSRSANLLVALALTAFSSPLLGFAQGTAFTYQGRLSDGAGPANGTYDLRFILYDNSAGGSQQGPILTNSSTSISNGLFTVPLDFGAQFPGAGRWLEIAVRTNGAVSFTTLSARQFLAPAPYAITAENVLNSGLSGTYSSAVNFNNNANSFAGNGGGLTNVNAATLNGLASSNFWKTAGNAGTTAGVNFIGTTDNQPLELRVNGGRTFRLEPNTNGAPNVIAGSALNYVSNGIVGATISGGGALLYNSKTLSNVVTADFGTIGGGWNNTAGNFATVGGGQVNTAGGINSTVAGGFAGNAAGYESTVGGGEFGNATGDDSVVGGGYFNFATAYGTTVAGGVNNNASGYYSTIGGGYQNQAGGTFFPGAATVAGGFLNHASTDAATVGGGYGNTASGTGSVVGGGGADGTTQSGNLASGAASVIGGGLANKATNYYATVSGGQNNVAGNYLSFVGGGILNVANGYASTVVGGDGSQASGFASVAGGYINLASGDYSVALGGIENEATAPYTFAAGNHALAAHSGTFVWADSQSGTYSSDRADQFKIRAGGGVILDVSGSHGLFPAALRVSSTSADGVGIFVAQTSTDATAVFTAAGTGDVIKGFNGGNNGNPVFEVFNGGQVYATSFNPTSDRNAKENFAGISASDILDRVLSLPVTRWNYKTETDKKHIGPMAQDFHAAFDLNGADDKHISLLDEGGVALAAIQGLDQKLEKRSEQLELRSRELETENAQLRQKVEDLKQLVTAMDRKLDERR